MEIEYNNKTKTITIIGFEPLADPILIIDDNEVQHLDSDNTYQFLTDGIYTIKVKESTLVVTDLGYFLVNDYSKDKNRALLVPTLDNRTYYTLIPEYNYNNKILKEIEFSFYSGNIERPLMLFKELKFNKGLC